MEEKTDAMTVDEVAAASPYSDPTAELRETVRRVLVFSAALLSVALAAGLVLSGNKLGFALGLISGGGVFAGRLLMLRSAVVKEAVMEPADARNHSRLMFAYRYFVTMAALALFAIVPFIDFTGGAIGLFLPYAAFYAERFRLKKVG